MGATLSMEQRKYFKHKITELEEIYSGAGEDCAVLEELEEELSHRSTQRAKKLLNKVQKRLNENTETEGNIAPPQQEFDVSRSNSKVDDESIDWESVLSNAVEHTENSNETESTKPLNNNPEDIIDAWTVLEALSPQTYKKPEDLIIGTGSVAHFRQGQEPWLKGEKSRPKHQLYYLMYLGAIRLELATEQLLRLYQDKRIERPMVSGLAALGVVILDKNGIPVPDTGLALSSFGWSYARALQGNLHDLKSWEAAEDALKEGLNKIIYRQDNDGKDLPFSFEQAQKAHNWLIKNCEIPQETTEAPTFAIRLFQHFNKGEPEAPLLNSFFLNDLQRAKSAIKSKKTGKALSQYLGITMPHHNFDLLNDKNHIEVALQPKNTPCGRWPSNGRHALVLLQQTAVNLAMNDLKDGGLFSVNGPPGTGKTTLLRDVVSGVLVKRAKALCAFKNTNDAFEHAGQMKLGNAFVHLYKLDNSMRGHEIVVASTNNKAVENVSKELPLRAQVAEDIEDFNYFNTVSNALSGLEDETWGLIAAVLGNSKNKSAFINKAWWDDNSGLRKYFLSITGQINFELDDNGEEIIPEIIEECDPPKNEHEAKQRWDVARKRFADAVNKSEYAISQAQHAYEHQKQALLLQNEVCENLERQVHQKELIKKLQQQSQMLLPDIQKVEKKSSLLLQSHAGVKDRKPGFLKRIFARTIWKQWKADYNESSSVLKLVQEQCALLQIEADDIEKTEQHERLKLSDLISKQYTLKKNIDTAWKEVEKFTLICGDKLVTPSLWQKTHEEQQMFTPNFTLQAQRLRDDVFVEAIKLHKAFIDASAKQMRQNLAAYFYCLGGGSLPHDKKALLPHLWSSAFLLTPVISTAFASVGRMFKDLPSESIGWLLIDEAGQATPQAAIGAIYRAKRVISVGDPLQIEPIVTLSAPLVEGISKHIGVDPDHWMAPDASVQTVSDMANCYGTTIPRDLSEIRIGLPLLVHRRCENPMFNISNKMAYAGLMVHADSPKPSVFTEIFDSQTRWFDIKGSAQEKWCPEEGDFVADMLISATLKLGEDPDIFVISPFRIVAERMRQRMRIEAENLSANGMSDTSSWISNNIGTVHTFQGKEAKAVILLLGAPNSTQNGARNWATSNVNLLNVAVSRAKQNFYVVGNRELWGDLGQMKLVNRYLD